MSDEKSKDEMTSEEEMSDASPSRNGPEMKLIWVALGLIGVFLFSQFFEVNISLRAQGGKTEQIVLGDSASLNEAVIPSDGVVLPVEWGNLGRQMVDNGVIDADAFEAIYAQRGGLSVVEQALLYGEGNGKLKINKQNAGAILNLLWAFGLSNKNPILEEGPMQNPKYGGADRFASTGGWTLAKGDAMDHYSRHPFITLTTEQQALVEEVSKNIYRPCCDNSTYFPDCNHGMAMLGLLELMAAQGADEAEMYKVALQVNSYWFPSTYLTIAKYFEERGVTWDEVSPKEILGSAYSGASGYRQILAQVEPPESSAGPSCGV